jgi:hypothetical protein
MPLSLLWEKKQEIKDLATIRQNALAIKIELEAKAI